MMLREIVLDTETTGTDPTGGDRVVEIGCVELVNRFPTGRTYHAYLNPQRSVAWGALAVHGLTDEFLRDKPTFASVADELATFIGDGRLVAHNAAFDIAFLNAEFGHAAHSARLEMDRVVDTLAMARRKHPGSPNSLDALCARYGIDNSRRTKHGALLDAELLAEVYIELVGGKQADLGLIITPARRNGADAIMVGAIGDGRPRALVLRLTEPEREAHALFIATLGADAVWGAYLEAESGQSSP